MMDSRLAKCWDNDQVCLSNVTRQYKKNFVTPTSVLHHFPIRWCSNCWVKCPDQLPVVLHQLSSSDLTFSSGCQRQFLWSRSISQVILTVNMNSRGRDKLPVSLTQVTGECNMTLFEFSPFPEDVVFYDERDSCCICPLSFARFDNGIFDFKCVLW